MLTIEPKAGIRLNLDSYHKIHSYQGGGEFWEHQNQQVLMQYLGEFLPRAVENEGGKSGTVLFSHLVAGKDVLSQSSALDANGPQAPAEQLNRLRAAVAALKAKESDALIDPNARKLIQAFRLPDPQKDAELYRITSGSPRRLLVLWGVEKERNSALTPEAAVARLQQARGARLPVFGGPSQKLVCALLLLLLLLGLGWWLWDRAHEKPVSIVVDDAGATAQAETNRIALGRDLKKADEASKKAEEERVKLEKTQPENVKKLAEATTAKVAAERAKKLAEAPQKKAADAKDAADKAVTDADAIAKTAADALAKADAAGKPAAEKTYTEAAAKA